MSQIQRVPIGSVAVQFDNGSSIPFLTVFTSTYNRTNTLPRLYESLCRQTDKDFEWIIVDDGSTDNTEAVVKPWLCTNAGFKVRYIKKKNGGFHTGYNVAIEAMDSVLAVCIDSDDWMPDDAVAKIHHCWMMCGSHDVAGIIGLDYLSTGELIGGLLPDAKVINLIKLAQGFYGIKQGDKKIVVRTDLYKSVAPMKVFPGERFFNPHYMHLQISARYDFLPLNECLCIVEYQPDGMGSNMFVQYKNSPNSFLEIRKLHLSWPGNPFWSNMKTGVHFVSSALLSRRYIQELVHSEHKGLLVICLPPGAFLAFLTIIWG